MLTVWAGESSGAELLLAGLALYGEGLLLYPLDLGTAAPVIVDSAENSHDIRPGLYRQA